MCLSQRWLLLASALHFCGHAAYDTFFALHVKALGLTESWTASAIAAGVLVETGIMLKGQSLLRRFSPRTLLLFAIGLAIPRWWLTGTLEAPMANVALQSLHGVTFGVFWLAAIGLVDRSAPTAIKTSALAVLSAAVGGFGSILGNFGGGVLVQEVGTMGLYQAAALTGLLALLAAWRIPAETSPAASDGLAH